MVLKISTKYKLIFDRCNYFECNPSLRSVNNDARKDIKENSKNEDRIILYRLFSPRKER